MPRCQPVSSRSPSVGPISPAACCTQPAHGANGPRRLQVASQLSRHRLLFLRPRRIQLPAVGPAKLRWSALSLSRAPVLSPRGRTPSAIRAMSSSS